MHGVAYTGDAGLADAFGARRGAFALRRVCRLKRPVRPVSSLRVRRCEVVGLRRQLNPGRGRSEPPTQQGDIASPPTGCEAQPHLGAAVAEQADAFTKPALKSNSSSRTSREATSTDWDPAAFDQTVTCSTPSGGAMSSRTSFQAVVLRASSRPVVRATASGSSGSVLCDDHTATCTPPVTRASQRISCTSSEMSLTRSHGE